MDGVHSEWIPSENLSDHLLSAARPSHNIAQRNTGHWAMTLSTGTTRPDRPSGDSPSSLNLRPREISVL